MRFWKRLFSASVLMVLMYMAVVLSGYIFSLPNPTTSTSGNSSPTPKILFFVPGIGCTNASRLELVWANLRALSKASVPWDCSVGAFVERQDFLKSSAHNPRMRTALEAIEEKCYVSYQPGAHYADFMKTLHPLLVLRAGYSHVLVCLDDVTLKPSFNLDIAVALSMKHHISILSPVVENALHFPVGLQSAHERKNLVASLGAKDVGVYTDFIEVFVALLSAEAWECWWSLVDPSHISKGWVYDEQLFHHCSRRFDAKRYPAAINSGKSATGESPNRKFTMGVLPHMGAVHASGSSDPTNNPAGYCVPLAEYSETRSMPPGEQYRLWHVERQKRGDESAPPQEICCEGNLLGPFRGV
mmetsp:Transcript_49240/g.97394  ORF Transcript_49240/g.97394 Transcript_49240/m.97394 type:complete len:357 (-) Transcript_49240:35-1105(-)